MGSVFAPIREIWRFIMALGDRMDKIHMGLISAGVAFYAMFAVFPGLAAIIAFWGLWYDPTVIQDYVHVAEEFVPPEAMEIVKSQVDALVSGGRTQLGWTTFVSFMIATVAARAGVNALVRGLNAAYGVRAHSTVVGFFLAYVLTLAIVGIVFVGLVTIVVVPIVLSLFELGPFNALLIRGLPWGGMLLIVMIGIGVLYRYGPNVRRPRTPIFTWGSVVATIAWEKLRSLAAFSSLFDESLPPRERLRRWVSTALVVVARSPLLSRLVGGDEELSAVMAELNPELLAQASRDQFAIFGELLAAAVPGSWSADEMRERIAAMSTVFYVAPLLRVDHVRQGMSIERLADRIGELAIDGIGSKEG